MEQRLLNWKIGYEEEEEFSVTQMLNCAVLLARELIQSLALRRRSSAKLSFLPRTTTCTDVNLGSIVPVEQSQLLCLWRPQNGFSLDNNRCYGVSPEVEIMLLPLVCSDSELLWGAS